MSLLCYIWLFGGEQYYRFDPYIDTQMADDYTPELFDDITVGMTKQEVENIIGLPLFIDSTAINEQIFRYTNDGKLLGKEVPWYMANDYAWYGSSIHFKNDTAINCDSGWYYD